MNGKDQKNGALEQNNSSEDEWNRAFEHLYDDDDESDGADESSLSEGTEDGSGQGDQEGQVVQTPPAVDPDVGNSDQNPSVDQGSQSAKSNPPDGTDGADGTKEKQEGGQQKENPQKSELAEQAEGILAQIMKMDPEVNGFGDLEDAPLFAALLDRGLSPEDAFRQSSPKFCSRVSSAERAASKAHLTTVGENKRTDDVDMSAINQFRAANPKMSKKDAITLYRRVTGK